MLTTYDPHKKIVYTVKGDINKEASLYVGDDISEFHLAIAQMYLNPEVLTLQQWVSKFDFHLARIKD